MLFVEFVGGVRADGRVCGGRGWWFGLCRGRGFAVCVSVIGRFLCGCVSTEESFVFLVLMGGLQNTGTEGSTNRKVGASGGRGGGGASCLRSVSVVSLRSGRVQTLWFCTLQPKSASPVASLFESGEIPILENSPYVLQMASSTRRR